MKKTLYDNLTKFYIFLISFSIIPVLLFTGPSLEKKNLPQLFFWILLAVAAEYKPIMIPSRNSVNAITMSFAVHLSSIILLGTASAVWISVLGTLIVEILSKRPLHKAAFNVGQYGLTLLISGTLLHSLKLSPPEITLDIIADMPAILIGASAYIFLNIFFLSVVFSLTQHSRFLDTFLDDFKVITGHFYTLAPLSIAISLLYDPKRPYVIFIMIPPLIMADQALRRYYSLHQATQETLNVLADTVDERDKYTYAHSTRVAEYGKKTAQQMSLSLNEVIEIETAGRIHDLGKIGIRDRILKKDQPLDDREFDEIKKHPEIAYRLLKNLKPYKKGAHYVLYHHERFDGKGYPNNISGKSIPLGARILTVADSYDAMTSDRPYRKALPQPSAVAELKKHSGSQFDPDVVQAFIAVLKNDYGYREV